MKRPLIIVFAAVFFSTFVIQHILAKGLWSGVAIRALPVGIVHPQNPGNVKTDPYAFLQDALRKPGAGEKQVQGILTRIDCDPKRGIIFAIKVGTRALRLRIDHFEDIKIATYTSDVAGDITCGIRKPENTVVMCYLPLKGPKAKADGTAKSVEFVPKDFQLSQP